jgi:hypothetical protein
LRKCNQRLLEKDWLNGKLKSFDYKLSEFKVEYNDDYLGELKNTINKEIDAILNLCAKSNFKFTKIEEEVHELRRKFRWLSIYAQALRGLIQLKKSTKKPSRQLNYFTKDVLDSPYNKLPSRPKNTAIIEFDSDSFFALSWLIVELGELKDVGLKVQKLADAIFIVEDVSREQSLLKAINALGLDSDIQNTILKKASQLTEIFIVKDKMMKNLVI